MFCSIFQHTSLSWQQYSARGSWTHMARVVVAPEVHVSIERRFLLARAGQEREKNRQSRVDTSTKQETRRKRHDAPAVTKQAHRVLTETDGGGIIWPPHARGSR